MQIYADFLSFFFLPNLSATSAQGLLNYDQKNAWRVERQAEEKRDNIPDKKRRLFHLLALEGIYLLSSENIDFLIYHNLLYGF